MAAEGHYDSLTPFPVKKHPPEVRQPTKETGAGEGIRTLDPDLGKVVLYP